MAFTNEQLEIINQVKIKIRNKFQIHPDFELEMQWQSEYLQEKAKPDEDVFQLVLGYWEQILGNESM